MDLRYHSQHLECPWTGSVALRCGKYGLPPLRDRPPPPFSAVLFLMSSFFLASHDFPFFAAFPLQPLKLEFYTLQDYFLHLILLCPSD